MKKFFNKYFWTLLVVIAALGLAGSAAYFSISGLSKLFAGSAMQVIIMASFIEFGKLVTTAALHRYWKKTKWWMKYTLTAMVIAVMMITSMGIYGFLSDAYATTSIELQKIEGKIELVEKQQEQKKVQINGIEEIKTSKSNRMTSLIELRSQQEVRLDSLLANHHWTNAKRTQQQIDEASLEIVGLQTDVDSLISRVNRVNEEIGVLDIDILNLQSSDVATEIGPLKYMSTVLDRPMDTIINWFILMLIFVFDPLAVLLVIFASNIYDANNEKTGPPEPEEVEEPTMDELLAMLQKQADEAAAKSSVNGSITLIPVEELEEDRQQKVVDAINNEGPEVLDFSHDFPGEEEKEVVKYVENKDGEFEKSNDSVTSLIKNIDSNPVYIKLIDVLFLDGERVAGDVIPPYKDFVKDIKTRNIECEDKVIKNFLTICNLLSITDMTNKDNVKITMDYESSKKVVSLVSK